MTATMTDKQRQAVAAMEAARRQGCSLSGYAKTNGLGVRRIVAILTMLRRRGLLPASGRKSRRPFVTVRVQPASDVARHDPERFCCRLERGLPDRGSRRGEVIECLQWPPPHWIAALSTGSTAAAS